MLLLCIFLLSIGAQDANAIWGWFRNVDFISPRTRHAMDVYPAPAYWSGNTQLVMLFGGQDQSGQPMNSVEIGSGNQWVMSYGFNGMGPTYTPGAPMPTPRYGLEAVTHTNGLCYVMGGTAGFGALNTVEVYNPLTNTWTNGVPMPTPRMDFSALLHDDKIYVVGGYNFTGPLASVDCFDPATGSWTTLTSMPTPRAGLMVYAENNFLYAAGGQPAPAGTPFVNPLNVVERYDFSTGTWNTELPMFSPRSFAAVTDLQLFVGWYRFMIGGYGPGGQPTPSIMGRPATWDPLYPFCSFVILDSIWDTSVAWPYPLYPVAEATGASGVGTYEIVHGITGGRSPSGTVLNRSFTELLVIALEDNRLHLEATKQENSVLMEGVIEGGGEFSQVWFERSLDGDNFFRVGDVQDYNAVNMDGQTILEKDHLPGLSTYYRLVAAKVDGAISHSNIVNIRIDQELDLSFYPNPFTQTGKIRLQGVEYGETVQYAVYDLNGREILNGEYEYREDKTIEGQGLAAGTYFLKVRTKEAEKIIRMVRN